ncbi:MULTISPECIES: hypothetical protein [Pontibacillus]|uniref:DUF3592 domain-containing protein n=1 Tax=Pontibacillus chungwhensis TaxID=265426 RepID=A0ABY8UU25_9BACI|nr:MULTISPECIES: hypothetical protein [Pontibacillus]MCD5323453.1 hypothetical protein [Pontibacillus sp. HN14]WIF96830.1 hypothetical protein QNI29_13855 [Pontibacillus chungwhensis]
MKHLLVGGIIFLILVMVPTKAMATSWAYPFVVWDNNLYVVTDEVVTDVGDRIGQVTRYSDMEQYGGNFSNVYKKGTNYYAIEGVSTDQAIAVKDQNGTYVKANWEKEYNYGFALPVGWISLIAILLVIGMVFAYWIRKTSFR